MSDLSQGRASEIGRSRIAIEDERLVQGAGRYVSDVRLTRAVHLAFVRSSYAHARLVKIDVGRALAMPGVLRVLVGGDLPPREEAPNAPAGVDFHAAPQPLLADQLVRWVGEPIAVVVAEGEAAAADAAALVDVEYEPLPSVADLDGALAENATLVHPEIGTNVGFTLRRGSGDVDEAFARADRVVSLRMAIPRIAAVPLEPLGIAVEWDSVGPKVTAWCTTQAPWRVHGALASGLGLPPEQVRVIAPDVGGGFGVRGPVYVEYLVVAHVAKLLGRPACWTATRREDFQVTVGSRETVVEAALAATADGRFLALRARGWLNLGAYATSPVGAHRLVTLLTGAYTIPAASVEISGVYTNTGPTGPYRGAGRPEASFVIERLVDLMAEALDRDPAGLRRVNFVPVEAFPYRNALGTTYDSGDYAAALDRALAAVRPATSASATSTGPTAGELIGVGFVSYVEPTGGGWESARVRFEPDGKVTAISGSVPQGQAHATTFAQIVADRLGVRFEDVSVLQGDTADNLPGIGTFGSRSTALGGGGLAVVADEVYERGRRIAGYLLEAAPEDVVAKNGQFGVVGVGAGDRAVSWAEVARAAASGDLPSEVAAELDARTRFDMGSETFAAGTCAAVVAIDPKTGVIRLRRLVLVHDCGAAINPRLLEAQLHGGLAQGAGEALGEWLRYDENGQLVAGSLLDYWLPHADELPSFELARAEVPSPLNRLGAKGAGEAGTIGAPLAILHAALNALRPLGVQHLDLPLTPERVWSAIRDAERSR
jgi:carbon-monoxide dehydrogenase large subunit